MKYYNLKSEECSRIEWDSIFYSDKRNIKYEMVGDFFIETVFIGHTVNGKLTMFETKVLKTYKMPYVPFAKQEGYHELKFFGPGEEEDYIDCDTIEEAREGHKTMVEKYLNIN